MTVIDIESLGKKYLLGQGRREPYLAFRDVVSDKARSIGRRFFSGNNGKGMGRDAEGEFWALRDVSFNVKQGEKIGIIGRNGAGKTTLLKILSRITEPTEGRVKIRGRVASLLEVGTGFHPELSGRENIYLNGAILGMRKAEIKEKFDEIVSFAEVEKFLDTPVKRYSSGMYVRLAFAVAAHLEPEILLVDEVLAVGDAAFQKKCIGKMDQVAGEGRTVFFVSHNMAIIQSLCGRGVLLSAGNVIMDGDTRSIVSSYLSQMAAASEGAVVDTVNHANRLPRMKPVINKVSLEDEDGQYTTDFGQGQPIILTVNYDASSMSQSLAGSGFILESIGGVRVGGFNTYMGMQPPHTMPPSGKVRFIIRNPILTPGRYILTVSVGVRQSVLTDKVERVLTFDVHASDVYGTGYLLTPQDGVVGMNCEVEIKAK